MIFNPATFWAKRPFGPNIFFIWEEFGYGKNKREEKKEFSSCGTNFHCSHSGYYCGFAHADSAFADSYIKPFGTIFLNLVKFIVGPIVLFSIMAGVVSLSDVKKVGKIGGITLVYYFCTTAIATVIGLILANLFKGTFPALETSSLTYEAPEATKPMDVVVNIFPNNFLTPITESNMLQIIMMALLIGFAVILLGGVKAQKAIDTINLLNDIFMKIMEMILKLSPFGVFCLLCPVVAANGPKVIGSLAKVLLCAYIAYVLHALIVYSTAVRTMGDMSPAFSRGWRLPCCLHFQVLRRSGLCRSIWNAPRNWAPLKKFLLLYFRSGLPSTWTEPLSIRVCALCLLPPAMAFR